MLGVADQPADQGQILARYDRMLVRVRQRSRIREWRWLRPQSNGFVERLHRTLLDEHFRIMGRKKFYDSIEDMQNDLDAYLITYNTQRPHQGRSMNGKTPAEVFVRCLPKPKTPKEEKMKRAV